MSARRWRFVGIDWQPCRHARRPVHAVVTGEPGRGPFQGPGAGQRGHAAWSRASPPPGRALAAAAARRVPDYDRCAALAQLEVAALLHAGPESLITGPAALAFPGIRGAKAAAVDVLVPAGRSVASFGFVVIHRTRRMPGHWAQDLAVRYALPPALSPTLYAALTSYPMPARLLPAAFSNAAARSVS